MPELPEVETIRRDLLKVLKDEEIKAIWVYDVKALEGISQDEASHLWQGKRVTDIKRRGKYLLFELLEGSFVVHLRMTGKLLVVPLESEVRYQRVRFVFSDKALVFADVRRFGRIYALGLSALDRLGPEPLEEEFTAQYLESILQKSGRPIKTFLLDQNNVAGLGNIYVDEALFMAKIHPLRPAKSLRTGEVKELVDAIKIVLDRAISLRGTSFSDYRDGFDKKGSFQEHLSVYGRAGEPCIRCGRVLEKIRVGGRSTVFCYSCQKGD